MVELSDGQWFITADGQVLQTCRPEGERMKYLRYPTTRPVTMDDLYTLDARAEQVIEKANKPWGFLFGHRRIRAELEQAYLDAGLEGAAAGHTIRPAEAQALISADGTIAGRSSSSRHQR